MVELGVDDGRWAVGKPLQQWDQVGVGNLLTFRKQPQVLEQLPLADWVQLVGAIEDVLQQGVIVLDDEVGVVANVEPEWLTVLIPQFLVIAEDDLLVSHDLWGSVVVTVQRNLPSPSLVDPVTDEELLLTEHELALVIDCCRNHWVAGLLQPGVHDLADVQAGSFAEGLPEVAPLGVVVLVSSKVVLQSLAQGIVTEQGPDHDQHPGTLGVNDRGVKDRVDFSWVVNRDVDWLNPVRGVPLQGHRGFRGLEEFPDVPVRVDGVDGDVFHHVGKALVEPEVIPPVHRDQVTKPLVRQFMGDHSGDQLLHVQGGVVRIEQEVGFPVGYQSPVFHGPSGEVGQGQLPGVRQRVRSLVEVFVELDGPLGDVEGKVEFLWLVGLGSEDADLDAGLGFRQLALHFPEGKGYQVGGHPDRLLEVVDAVFDVVLGHVGDDRFTRMFVVLDGEAEGSLGRWLVDAWKGLPGRRGFKLGPDQLLLFPVDLVIGWVDPHHGVGQGRGVVDGQRHCSGLREGDVDRFRLVISGKRHILTSDLDAVDVEVLLVDGDLRLAGVTGDGRPTADRLFTPVDVEVEVIVFWLECFQQSLVCCH